MEYGSGIAGRAAVMTAAAHAVNPDCHVMVTRKHFPGTKRSHWQLLWRAALWCTAPGFLTPF